MLISSDSIVAWHEIQTIGDLIMYMTPNMYLIAKHTEIDLFNDGIG